MAHDLDSSSKSGAAHGRGRRMRRLAASVYGVVAAAMATTHALAAEEVVLRLKGGNFQVQGTLLSFDGKSYVVMSSQIGTLSLFADRFECIGQACRLTTPAQPAPPAREALPAGSAAATIAGPARLSLAVPLSTSPTLMPDLIKGWIAGAGGSIVREVGAETGEMRLRVLARGGAEMVRFAIQRRDAAAAFAALQSGSADIVVTDRRIDDVEAKALAPVAGDMRSAQRESVLALDALAVVVAPENPLTSLSIADISRIFSGQVNDWADLGQPAGRIKVYTSDTSTGPGGIFDAHVLRPGGRTLAASTVRLASSEAVAEAVSQERFSIGVTAFADMRSAKPVNIVQSCGLITNASAFAIKTEEYPLSRRIYLYTSRMPAGEAARAFLDFVATPAGQDIVSDHQLVDQRLVALAMDGQTARFAHAVNRQPRTANAQLPRLLAELAGARRTSMTIRFESGTSQIDSKSQNDLKALVEHVAGSQAKGARVMLLGFTDNVGGAPKNAALAAKRAAQARTALLATAAGRIEPARVVASGHETLAPIACDDTERGRQLNRRVEVWLRDEAAAPRTPAASGP